MAKQSGCDKPGYSCSCLMVMMVKAQNIRMHGSNVSFRYQLQATLSDGSDTIEATFFDRTTTQLLQLSCTEMISRPNKQALLQDITNKELQLQIQANKDKKYGATRCTVNSAAFIVPQSRITSHHSTSATSSTPVPTTPALKAHSHTSTTHSLIEAQGLQSPITQPHSTCATPTTPAPTTPALKGHFDTSAKRSLIGSEAFEDTPAKKKIAEDPKI